jgi:uncharacterized protein (TIGR02118 family)
MTTKVVYVLHRRQGTTREEMNKAWRAQLPLIASYPGLTKWVHNYVVSPEGDDAVCDGFGEHYFESEEALWATVNSAELADAVEDAKTYLDMDKTKMIVVRTETIFDRDN